VLAAALEQVNQNLESCTKKEEKKNKKSSPTTEYLRPTTEYLLLAAVLEQENQNHESSIMKKEKKKKKSSQYQKPTPKSLADALEVKQNWLIEYLTKQSPQMERQHVDNYWVEAFKRNNNKRFKAVRFIFGKKGEQLASLDLIPRLMILSFSSSFSKF
jgi:hypothetical protein